MGENFLLKMKFIICLALCLLQIQAVVFKAVDINKNLAGVWVCQRYKMIQMNPWHTVQLKALADNKVLWTNKAGKSWILTGSGYQQTATHHILTFSVGKNPYGAKHKMPRIVYPKK